MTIDQDWAQELFRIEHDEAEVYLAPLESLISVERGRVVVEAQMEQLNRRELLLRGEELLKVGCLNDLFGGLVLLDCFILLLC